MQPNRASITAQNNALLRAHEFMRPPDERICSDAFAACFLDERLMAAVDREHRIRSTVDEWEERFPGVGNAILARTRFIDDCLAAAIGAGIGQLVILGAGYDTRALRFATLRDTAAVFELDHPNTQRIKRDRIKTHVTADLSHVRFTPIDFSKEALDEKLFACGFCRRVTTLFIWEGVTYYLSERAVDRTLAFIRGHALPGSSVVFDYFSPAVADGTTRLAEARALRDGLAHIGEKIHFGIAPDRIVGFMRDRGFNVIRQLCGGDYRAAYLTGPNRSRNVSEIFNLVQARVEG
jgi:methyltransferase (TIGR00027 family)